ncbi:hypothetical protein KKE34_04095 [Patescibacteria group bacterium]|nr:hypothetical protein [Patescibacteria group bacterium]MBU1885761.1 hypothetical protein [Patescibacteria group bacterium]
MIKELNKHKLAYLVLAVGLVLGVVLFLGAWPDRRLQRIVAIGISIFYLLWGISTHFKSNQIDKKIVLEYAGVGALAGLLLVLVTL